jgi:hypothetical protein
MFALARLMVVGFLVLSVVYLCLSLYSRQVRRRKLNAEWEAENSTGDRDEFIAQGMAEYDASLRPKLLLGVYVVPTVIIGVIIYLTNFA